MSDLTFPCPWRRPRLSPEEERLAIEYILSVSHEKRLSSEKQLQLDYPQVLMGLPEYLRERLEGSPAAVRDDAEFFYGLVEKKSRYDMGLLDERDYAMGEFALLAGMACRGLSRREEARLWFDRADAAFLHLGWSRPMLLELLYQKLALRIEERQFREVLALLPRMLESFSEYGMTEAVLKCRSLQGLASMESGQLDEAAEIFRGISQEARALGNGKLLGSAFVNLMQIYAFLGDSEKAFDVACEATPLLRSFGNRIDLAKLQWGLGTLFRGQGKLSEAVDAYRAAQKQFAEIEMRADVAAVHLVVADLLLELGQDKQARWEIQTALPVIDEYKLVPEGVAALSLLRESLSNHRINQKALRELHGYFPARES